MSYKISFILSLIFVAIFFLFAGDLIALQFVYSDLDAKSVNIGFLISEHGSIEKDFITSIEERFNVSFKNISNYNPTFGDVVDYTLSTYFDPMVISSGKMTVTIKRSTVLGFYG